ncbi:MAG TPA: nitrilase-related carbon-nitrogen hydrolase, partial [Tepidisphaeraceae bacterium]|nr:nitrilase-related carbon-nitrogen hydrolase [Tepidisphaeraceae bacterium]
MRIALAQINTTVGDIAGNLRRILDFTARAKSQGATLCVFPELSVTGYPPKDLLLKPQFISDNLAAIQTIADQIHGIHALVGYAQPNDDPIGRPLRNALALVADGQIKSRHFKTLLPTYDVFDESRYFEPGHASERGNLARIDDRVVGLSICEDLWNDEKMMPRRLYHQNPISLLNAAGAEILINASASPFVVGKHEFRLSLFSSQVRQFSKPLVYVNQVGGNDELVFDGNSLALDADGQVIAQAKDFDEDLLLVDFPAASPARRECPSSGIESIYNALILGLRDYVRKCGFKTVVLGLSGGIDSALTAALAVDALGSDKVVGVAMPSRFSSEHSLADARQLAANLGIEFQVVPIELVHTA